MGINYKKAWADPLGKALIITKAFSALSAFSLLIAILLLLVAPLSWQIFVIPFLALVTTLALYFRAKTNSLLAAEGKNQSV
jgi:membrane protein implicated in regulation of membrane protease activity